MRKIVFLIGFVLAAGVIWALFFERKEAVVNPEQHSLYEAKYIIGRVDETIDKLEAEKNPPIERWQVIKDLKETIAIDLVCQSSSSQIVDQNTLKEFVELLQKSKYVEVTEYPKREPDIKLYFRKKGGFILAGRFFVKEGVINSPEGPVIKIDSTAVKNLKVNTDCES